MLTDVEARDALSEWLQRQGVHPANHLVDVEINREPAFANDLGEFDQQTFESVLAQATGLTAQQVKDSTRDDIAQKHLVMGLAAGLDTPKIYGAVIASYLLESRSLSYFVLDPHSIPMLAQPTDAQLQALLNEHATELTRPEMRTLSVVRFSAKSIAPSMLVDEMKVQALYRSRVGDLSQPEKRSLIEFTTQDAAKAAAILAKLKAGQDPAAIAKALGVQPITYDDKAEDRHRRSGGGRCGVFRLRRPGSRSDTQARSPAIAVIKLTKVTARQRTDARTPAVATGSRRKD